MSQNTQLVTLLSKYTKRISLALALLTVHRLAKGGRLIVRQQSVSESKEMELLQQNEDKYHIRRAEDCTNVSYIFKKIWCHIPIVLRSINFFVLLIVHLDIVV